MKLILKLLISITLALAPVWLWANDDDEFLPVDQAFQVESSQSGNHIHLTFHIADGYYLYKHRFSFTPTEGTQGQLGEPIYQQAAKPKEDPIFGQVEVFYAQVDVYLPVLQVEDGFIEVDTHYQGCAEKGLCYVPQTYTDMYQIDPQAASPEIPIESAPHYEKTDLDSQAPEIPTRNTLNSAIDTSSQKESTDLDADDALSLERFLKNAGLITILGAFFLLGIGLTFTPCVLPMIPILSGIIVGQGADLSRAKAATLSLTYVLGMAFTYAILGVIAGVTGAKLQVALQNPTVLFSFAGIFCVLSLSMFGFYELQLPRAIQDKLNNFSQKQQGGTYLGVAIIGVLSALVVSPCVSAPLAGALLYIGQSGDWLLGGSALLALGLGMGAPLLLIGISGANLLPKAGGWMDNVKGLFGVMLLAVALWLTKHLIADTLLWIIAGGLMILAGLYFGGLDAALSPKAKLFKAIGLTLILCGAVWVIKPLIPAPTYALESSASASITAPFQRVRSGLELDNQLTLAQQQNKPVMLDFYADWCTACLEMEHETFTDPNVQAQLRSHQWLQVDLTDNPEATELLSRFGLPGPPALLFFNSKGNELKAARIYAYKTKNQFLSHLKQHLIH